MKDINAFYKAKEFCHIGGLRKPGDVFRWERFEPCPKHLEELGAESIGEITSPVMYTAPGPTSSDIEALAPTQTADKAQSKRGHKS